MPLPTMPASSRRRIMSLWAFSICRFSVASPAAQSRTALASGVALLCRAHSSWRLTKISSRTAFMRLAYSSQASGYVLGRMTGANPAYVTVLYLFRELADVLADRSQPLVVRACGDKDGGSTEADFRQVTTVPSGSPSSKYRRRLDGIRPSRMSTRAHPAVSAFRHALILGIIPPLITPCPVSRATVA